ncbi:hypothetical protein I6F35_34195 [Bradyrhizobium sp. BRP22]|uniref:hypothetical protein n=1 Tax=Bradyrhizobium sp. BRP22 TaxID=2793821 RepID=UPI001CD2AB69|nr:hypothetical protein [Bradyrhizobium sp. BRP22]MCA1458183.1 hypothetical protein [Bradyrhizobium sp. BRP22]
MEINVSWHSQTGKRTTDNRDCGGIGIRSDETLCIVLDGSTTAPDSGMLAHEIMCGMIDWYVASDEAITTESLDAAETDSRHIVLTASARFGQLHDGAYK